MLIDQGTSRDLKGVFLCFHQISGVWDVFLQAKPMAGSITSKATFQECARIHWDEPFPSQKQHDRHGVMKDHEGKKNID